MGRRVANRIFPAAIIVLGMVALSFSRLKVPRDTTLEEDMDKVDVAQAYDDYSSSPVFRIERYLTVSELKKHNPEGILLDAGCGPGRLSLDIMRRFPELKIIGLDISRMMLKRAGKNISAYKYQDRMHLCKANVLQLPLESDSIDFVVSTLAMHHWPDPERALREIHRVLKPGGQFLIVDLRRDIHLVSYALVWLIQELIAPVILRRTNGGIGSIRASFTPAELETLLSASPFRDWTLKKRVGWVYVWGRKR